MAQIKKINPNNRNVVPGIGTSNNIPVKSGDYNDMADQVNQNTTDIADTVNQVNQNTTDIADIKDGFLYQGVIDCSTNPNYPAATQDQFWRVSVAGLIGGGAGVPVEVGDQVICIETYAGGIDGTKFMIVQTTTQITDVTYAQLQTLITNATLETGRQYRITDYATAYNVFDGGTNTVIEAQLGTAEPLIVLATGTTTLAKEAYSALYPQDIIYYNPLVNAVERAAFLVAGDIGYVTTGSLVAGFKGIIEFRHDTKQNVSTWYDFRNIKFRRWAVDAVAYDVAAAYVAKDVAKSSDGNIYSCILATNGGPDPSEDTVHWILWMDITSDAYVSWTTDNSVFNIGFITPTNLVFVPATYQDVYTFGDWYQHVNSVTIGKNDLALVADYGFNSTLNNIVFKTTDNIHTCYSNEIGEMSYNNTLGNSFTSNIIGNYFYTNIISNNFYNNTSGDEVYKNTLGNNFRYNTLGSKFNYNTIGNSFNYNTLGNSFIFNTLGNSFTSNIIGDSSSNNIIGNDFYSNTIGNSFISNTLGNSFTSNIIGDSSSNNIIGNDFYSNTIGNNFSSNTIGDGFHSNIIGHNFSSNTIGSNFQSNTIGNNFQTNTIGSDFSSNTIGNNSKVSAGINCQGNSIGDYNTLVTLGDTCAGISVGEKNGTITLGASCTNLTFQNGCTFTNTNATALINTTFENGSVVNGLDFAAATHIKAAYSKTVFMNATPTVQLSYINAANALTAVNVNA